MLEKYRHLIYKDEEERGAVIDNCLAQVLEKPVSFATDEERQSFIQNLNTGRQANLTMALLMEEGYRLYKLTYEKFGKELWSHNIWSAKKDCRKDCPFGNVCRRVFLNIDGKYYCYGQLTVKNINYKRLESMIKSGSRVKMVKHNRTVILDTETSLPFDYEQWLCNYFFEYDVEFTEFYGAYWDGIIIVGENVISRL